MPTTADEDELVREGQLIVLRCHGSGGGGGGIRTHGALALRCSRPTHSTALPPLRESKDNARPATSGLESVPDEPTARRAGTRRDCRSAGRPVRVVPPRSCHHERTWVGLPVVPTVDRRRVVSAISGPPRPALPWIRAPPADGARSVVTDSDLA